MIVVRPDRSIVEVSTDVCIIGSGAGGSATAAALVEAGVDTLLLEAGPAHDASTFDLPEYIQSRLQPQILIDFPERDEEIMILRENLPFGDEQVLEYVTDFLQMAHANEERFSARDGINIARYALKLRHMAEGRLPIRDALHTAIMETLGGEALRYVPRA